MLTTTKVYHLSAVRQLMHNFQLWLFHTLECHIHLPLAAQSPCKSLHFSSKDEIIITFCHSVWCLTVCPLVEVAFTTFLDTGNVFAHRYSQLLQVFLLVVRCLFLVKLWSSTSLDSLCCVVCFDNKFKQFVSQVKIQSRLNSRVYVYHFLIFLFYLLSSVIYSKGV